jgi:enoyl-CoA hydratase/carnithine racemase
MERTDQPSPILRAGTIGAVGLVTLCDERRRNALSETMIATLHHTLREMAVDPGVRAVVISAEGPAFCAGHDLKELSAFRKAPDRGLADFRRVMGACSEMMLFVGRMAKPVVAAVEGVATAAGCQLVATCDLAVGGASARFQTPGVKIGLFCSTPMVALSRKVGRAAALDMLLTGEPLDAPSALRIGLLNRVVEPGEALPAALRLAEAIAANAPRSIAIGKSAFYAQAEMGVEEAYGYASEVMSQNMLEAEAEEGIGAFLGKRAPNWPPTT